MKKYRKMILFLILLLVAFLFNPSFSKATTTTVNDENELLEAIGNAENGDVIELSTDIVLTKPVSITGKNIAINGNGHTITREATNWTPDGSNSTLITAGGNGTKLNLVNVKLTNSEKYGVQSYNGAYVILDGVTISGCGYGGILVNAGTVEVKNLNLGKNGAQNNNGIEIAKGLSVDTGDNNPTLIMNGTLTSTETENVVYLAVNDNLSEFEVQNTETTTDKVLVSGNKVVITDENNNILFESNENDELEIAGDNFVENITVTVNVMDQLVPISVQPGTTLTEEAVRSNISLEDLGLANYTLEGFYDDAEFTTPFDFSTSITVDTTIYAKLALKPTTPEPEPEPTPEPNPEENDETPKTGVQNYSGVAISIIAISVVSLAVLTKKRI